ncbi:MAG: response regulator [Cyanobacteria bacterium SIG31]|nr:response regulator [Cyanobacteria bacterium SIG31]
MENSSRVFILDSNENSREVIKSYLEDLGYIDVKSFSDYKSSINEIKESGEDSIVFIDLSDYSTVAYETLEVLRLLTNRLIVTSSDYSTDTIIKALRNGAKDFLPKPIIKDELKKSLNQLLQQENSTESASKIITIYSNKGGIGKTTIATNLAVELSKTTREKVALIDLNLQLGDVSTFLNINPAFDVAYVIKNLIEKREETLLNAFEKYKDTNLYVLSDPTYIEHSESITPQQIEILFKTLRKVFPYIIIDLSSGIDPNTLKILDKSDIILYTTIVNIPAIRNAQRCLNLFKSRRYDSNKVKIILNRFMENDEISLEDIENTLGERVYWKIPNNYFSIMEAINKGITVSEVNSSSNIANNFKDLSIKIADDIVKQAVFESKRGL